MNKVIHNISELTVSPSSLPLMPIASKVMMVDPAYFHVDNPINAHMRQADGSLHILNKNKAYEQWENLKQTYKKIGLNVYTVNSVPGLPDMVFCANQCFPFLDSLGNKHAVLSNMFHDIRNKEVSYIHDFLLSEGYQSHRIAARSEGFFFESMGDALWLPGKRFILGGYGFRTDKKIYPILSEIVDAPVAVFELTHPKFYHLDTCLSVLNADTALYCKEAFTHEGLQLLEKIFKNLLAVPLKEADSPGFACNADCPDGKHVILQTGCSVTEKLLQNSGFIPLSVDTSEFIKSGGSVFCMKLMFF